jgi:hypothetical protein
MSMPSVFLWIRHWVVFLGIRVRLYRRGVGAHRSPHRRDGHDDRRHCNDAGNCKVVSSDSALLAAECNDWPTPAGLNDTHLFWSECCGMLLKYNRTPILVALAVLTGCAPHAARVAEDSTPRLKQLTCDTVDFVATAEATTAALTEDNIEVLREREKALTALRAAGVLWGHPKEPHLAARARVTRFATEPKSSL